jgi:hypothetical protein
LQEYRQAIGVEPVVRIQDGEPRSLGQLQAEIDGCVSAPVLPVALEAHASFEPRGESRSLEDALHHVGRSIGRGVIDDHELELAMRLIGNGA